MKLLHQTRLARLSSLFISTIRSSLLIARSSMGKKCEKNIWKIKIPHFLFSFKNSTKKQNEKTEKEMCWENLLPSSHSHFTSSSSSSSVPEFLTQISLGPEHYTDDYSRFKCVSLPLNSMNSSPKHISFLLLKPEIFMRGLETSTLLCSALCLDGECELFVLDCGVEGASWINQIGYLSPCVPPHRMLACPSPHPQLLTH